MSSLRNAVKRRTHKERSQPAERRKFGLLEKKKDYILRARDFHKKEDALKVLRKKAANRNPDEFYFAMQKQRTNDGVHIANEDLSNKYTQDELHLMKTQDVKYVAMKASMEAVKRPSTVRTPSRPALTSVTMLRLENPAIPRPRTMIAEAPNLA